MPSAKRSGGRNPGIGGGISDRLLAKSVSPCFRASMMASWRRRCAWYLSFPRYAAERLAIMPATEEAIEATMDQSIMSIGFSRFSHLSSENGQITKISCASRDSANRHAFSEISQPMALRPSCLATCSVVPEPQNGSSIVSPDKSIGMETV